MQTNIFRGTPYGHVALGTLAGIDAITLNGAGEMTGLHWVQESGFLESPLGITNTHSVGAVHEAIVRWQVRENKMFGVFSLPLVAETSTVFTFVKSTSSRRLARHRADRSPRETSAAAQACVYFNGRAAAARRRA